MSSLSSAYALPPLHHAVIEFSPIHAYRFVFLSLHTSKSHQSITPTHTRAHTGRWMDGWMDGTCKPPKKGWEKTVSTLGTLGSQIQSFSRQGSLPRHHLREERGGGGFCFIWFLASQQAATKEAAHSARKLKKRKRPLSSLRYQGRAHKRHGQGPQRQWQAFVRPLRSVGR